MVLYKYTNLMTALEIITKSTLKFTPSKNFNDPFELSTCFFGNDDNTNLMLLDFYGVLSLTRTPLNPIMWSSYASGVEVNESDKSEHYLNKINLLKTLGNDYEKSMRLDIYNQYHTGVVFGIDCDIAGLNESYNVIPAQYGSVIYTKTRPCFDYSGEKRKNYILNGCSESFDINHIKLLTDIFLYKSDDWSYEEEVRVVRNVSKRRGIYQIDRKAIKEVYIGMRNAYNNKYIDNFSKIINEYLPGCSIYACKLDDKNWSFCRDLIKSRTP